MHLRREEGRWGISVECQWRLRWYQTETLVGPVCHSDVTRSRIGASIEIPIKNAYILTVKQVLKRRFERKTYSPPGAATPRRARGASGHLRASAKSAPIPTKLHGDPRLSSRMVILMI